MIDNVSYFPWALIEQWPANGVERKLARWNLVAKHVAATAISKEKLIIKKGRWTYTRVKIGTKFANMVVS